MRRPWVGPPRQRGVPGPGGQVLRPPRAPSLCALLPEGEEGRCLRFPPALGSQNPPSAKVPDSPAPRPRPRGPGLAFGLPPASPSVPWLAQCSHRTWLPTPTPKSTCLPPSPEQGVRTSSKVNPAEPAQNHQRPHTQRTLPGLPCSSWGSVALPRPCVHPGPLPP